MRFGLAKAIGAASTWALQHVFGRPAANAPGRIGLQIDPQLIAHFRSGIREGVVAVVGTNGKTTVNNLLADAFEASGKTIACNRTGANLAYGVASALMHAEGADWGVIESDELWFAKVSSQLQPDVVVLLNLFRDQLDRMGEIDHVQQSIVQGLKDAPHSTLVYNADDPLCQAIADAVDNDHVAFGIGEDLGLTQDTVVGSGVCQRCDTTLAYTCHQYGHLGVYQCPTCGFVREEPTYRAHGVHLGEGGVSFEVPLASGDVRVESSLPGSYMVYNLLAVCAAAECCHVDFASVDKAVRAFSPHNGRLQSYRIGDRSVLLNLAKNPTGFNQNLRIVLDEQGPRAVAFYINDNVADGHDVSWLWDVDFQQLAGIDGLVACAGGTRANDMQVRLKYAGVHAQLVDNAQDFLKKAWEVEPEAKLFLVANYTALPGVKGELDRMQRMSERERLERLSSSGALPATSRRARSDGANHGSAGDEGAPQKLVITHMYPELLNLYGDGGNVIILADRARRRGLDVEVVRVLHGQTADLDAADIVFLGGGPDREQRLASVCLLGQADALRAYVEDDGVLLAICGGFQIIGKEWLLGGETVLGLDLVDVTTKRAPGGSHNRIVDNIVLDSPLADIPVVGYENHAGRTYLGEGCQAFGRVIKAQGRGNNDDDGADGVIYRNLVGTYLHGPLLAKNPEVADALIERALARRCAKSGCKMPSLEVLDDTEECAANEAMRAKLHVE